MSRSTCCLIAGLLAAWALVLSAMTSVPSEDGVSYLWMAQQFAAGEFRAALSSVFPPGYPLLLAPGMALGADPERLAQALGALALAATVWPLARLGAAFAPGAAWPTVVLFAASPLLPRLAAEAYSEPAFVLVMAWGAWWGTQQRWWSVGTAAAVAFAIRPEGSLLAASFVCLQPWRAWRALLPLGGSVLLLAGARAAAGHGFDVLPLLAFHEQRDDLPDRGMVLVHLLRTPGLLLEAYVLAALLLVRAATRRLPVVQRPAMWQVLLQIAVVATFVARRRFFVSCANAVYPLAGAVLAGWSPRWRHAVLGGSVLLGVLLGLTGGVGADRAAEAAVGRWLAPQLQGQELVTDLPRIAWFAGHRPPAPRHFTAAQLLAQANAPDVRHVVLSIGSKRGQFDELQQGLTEAFVRVELPASLRELADRRGIAVFARR